MDVLLDAKLVGGVSGESISLRVIPLLYQDLFLLILYLKLRSVDDYVLMLVRGRGFGQDLPLEERGGVGGLRELVVEGAD